jgi:hypothetical protein
MKALYLRYPTAPSSLFKRAFLCECPIKRFSILNLRLVPRWGIHPLIDQLIIEKQKYLESPLVEAVPFLFSRQEGMNGE